MLTHEQRAALQRLPGNESVHWCKLEIFMWAVLKLQRQIVAAACSWSIAWLCFIALCVKAGLTSAAHTCSPASKANFAYHCACASSCGSSASAWRRIAH
jgi:hypothetical protein